jgi:gliding motility-associated-like protein
MRKLLTTSLIAVLLPLAAFSQCNALKLTVDKQIQCAPGIINFKVTGAPKGSKYLWNFGKGFVSNTDTVYEFFLKPQVVNVQVNVSFPDGTQCVVAKKSIAQVLGKPELSYDISRRKLCDGPDTVTFFNTTPNTKQISWVVDGTNYFNAGNKLIHQFKTIGNKNINLVVTDSFGCRNVKEFKDVAVVYPDVNLDFVADNLSGCVTKYVQLEATVHDNGEKITSTEWHIPGSNRAYASGLLPPEVKYVVPGAYDVSFTVDTEHGCSHELLKENYLNYGDSIKIDLNLDDSILCLYNSTSVSVKNPLKNGQYIWSFEGSPDTTQLSQTDIGLKYSTPGEYNVEVTLNYAGCFSKKTLTKAVKVKTLKADFSSVDNYHCYTPHLTHITNTSTSYQDAPLTYKWSITGDDGKVLQSSKDTNLVFPSPDWGRYSVELVAMDPFGCVDTFMVRQFIRVDSIRPTMTSDERIGCVDQNIKLTSITPASSYISPDSFYWVVYDLDGKSIYNKGKGRHIEQSFSKPGYYNVTLFAGNLIGCIDSLPKKRFIHIIEPKKSISIADSSICAGEEASFTANTTPDFAPFVYSWLLTNEQSGETHNLEIDTGRSRSVKLDKPGSFTVQYNHQISAGCKDSIIAPAALHVNGVSGSVVLDAFDGCLPFEVKPTFNVAQNLHFGNASDSITFTWRASPANNVDITGANTANPEFVFNDRGTYRIYVDLYNSSDCKFNTYSQQIFAGVKADFSIPNDSLCAHDSIPLTNSSSLNPTSFKWNVNSTGKYALRQSVTPTRLILRDDAFYEIQLIASKRNECFDTATKMVRSIVVKSAFEMADTHLFCAPAYAQFNTLSENADTFFWNFGDGTGITTTDTFIANIYHRNTGFDKGFDVTLTSKSYLGCSDKVTINDAIRVFGPVPDFEIRNFVGCEPLQVEFINKSKDAAQFYLNYDDNTPLDSSQIDYHVFTVQNTGMSQRYIPSLYEKDILGCAAAIESVDTVHVLKSPKAIPSDKEIEGCSPVQVALTDESLNISSRSWLLNDVEISTANSVSPSISTPGTHLLKLVVTNQNNCYDTSEFKIKVNSNPIADLQIMQIPCMNNITEFKAKALSKIGVLHYVWSVNNTLIDTLSSADFSYKFVVPGRNPVQLEVIDFNRCRGVLDTAIIMKGVDQIPDGIIKVVSINDNKEIEIQWGKIDPDFLAFRTIVDHNSLQTVYKNSPNSDTITTIPYADIKVARCFSMTHSNLCGEKGIESITHCPVLLTVTQGGVYELDLTWTPYGGWNDVDRYTILRSDDGISYSAVGEVNGTTRRYTDKLLCDQDYVYRVRAERGTLVSNSNFEGNRPVYERNGIPMDIKVATVANNKVVAVTWDTSLFAHPHEYLVCKHDVTGTKLIDSKIMTGTSFTDQDVDINQEHFIYTVQTIDHCKETGVVGNVGLPMILEGNYMNDMSHLSWTAYRQWDDGVDYYQIQILDNGEFSTIGEVPGTQTAYVDKDGHDEIDGQYVFRIIAVSYDSSIRSTSNEITLIGSSLVWIPNAFSPNEDDHNPNFKPSPKFIYLLKDGTYREYEMTIFNRWGELLFTTNNVKEGWDGTYNGKDCEMESYLYHIRISGLDRVVYDKKGLVRLMR